MGIVNLMISTKPIHALFAALVTLGLLLCLAPTSLAAPTRIAGSPSSEPTGRLFISPGRVERDVQPGVRSTIKIRLTNDSDGPFDISLRTSDTGPAESPFSVASAVENGQYGAGDWLTPEIIDLRLDAWETIEFNLIVDPPDNAPVGTSMAGLIFNSGVAEGAIGTADSTSMFKVEGLIQIFLNIPGPIKNDLRIVDVTTRDSVMLGNQRFVVWDVTFANYGTVNDHVSGELVARSIFGNAAQREKISNLLVLRGGKRTTRVVWRDLPLVGAFTPHVRIQGDDQKVTKKSGKRIVILPWWIPAGILVLIIVPMLTMWLRRRREWQQYLEQDEETWDALS